MREQGPAGGVDLGDAGGVGGIEGFDEDGSVALVVEHAVTVVTACPVFGFDLAESLEKGHAHGVLVGLVVVDAEALAGCFDKDSSHAEGIVSESARDVSAEVRKRRWTVSRGPDGVAEGLTVSDVHGGAPLLRT